MSEINRQTGYGNVIYKQQFEDTRSDGYAYLRQYIITSDGSGNRSIFLNWYNPRKNDIIKIKFTVFQYDANGDEISRMDVELSDRIKGQSYFGNKYKLKGGSNCKTVGVEVRAIDYLGYSVRFDDGIPTEIFPPKKNNYVKRADTKEVRGEEVIYGASRPLIITFLVITSVVAVVAMFEWILGLI